MEIIHQVFGLIEAGARMLCASACLSFGIFGGGFVIWWYRDAIRQTKAEKKAAGSETRADHGG